DALARQPVENPWFSATPDSVAYVLYTSGSTGVPKGVAVTHTNIVHYARAASRVLADVPQQAVGDGFATLDAWKFGLASTLAADLGNTSVFPALFAGGTLHVLSKEVTTEPSLFASYMAANALDVVKITPNHLIALLAGKRGKELAAVLPAKWVVTGGEALKLDAARLLLSAGSCRVLNHYGPTETTVGVCTFEVTQNSLDGIAAAGAQSIPVGHPLVNTHAFVVDARVYEVPVGVIGDLLIGGWGVTQGYLHNAERTAEVFVQHNGQRVYRTGDRVRRLSNGAIEFLGRGDHQIKIRGYRVELGDIEQVIGSHPGLESAVVTLRANAAGDAGLVAYVVPLQGGYAVAHADRPTVEKIREWAAVQLPDYMVPGSIIMLDALPLTANGKVDRAALPSPDAQPTRVQVAPRTDTERQLVSIWSTVLKVEDVGVTDRFLDLGGHSLLAIRVLGRISKDLGVRLALRSLFETPTIAEIAVVIDAERAVKEAEQRRKTEDASMLAALADIENLSDDEVAQMLGGDVPDSNSANPSR
ncbi:MAG: AMP-binding protein, partial [Phycisphaerae bacterium]|nr:AMP-binding protein [Gemmatimonadaceae bacterium]